MAGRLCGRPRLLLSLALALLAIAMYDLWGLVRRSDASAALVQHTYQAIGAADALLSIMKDAETGQRGYLLTGEPAYLEPYEDGVARVRAQLHGLASLVADDPAQAARLPAIDSLIEATLAELARTVTLRRGGDAAGALAVVRGGTGKARMDELRAALATFTAEEQRLLTERRDRYLEVRRQKSLRIGLGAVLALLAGAAAVAAPASSERELAARVAEIGAIYASAPVGLAYVDRDLRYRAVSNRLAGIDGRSAAAYLGRPIREVLPEVADAIEPIFRRVLATGQPVSDVDIRTATAATHGAPRDYVGSYWPVKDGSGRVVGVNVSVVDVTERKAAEAALAASEARLRLALEAGRMGTWSWTLGQDRLDWDARQHELFGFDPAAGPVTREAAHARVHPEDRAGLEATVARVIEAGNGAYETEFRVILPGGGARWIGGYGHAVPDETGRAVRLTGLSFDVSERRAAAEALARLNEDLERRVEAEVQAREAAQTRAAHAERMQALGQLAGGIAHDFNNVLQGVQGGARVIERRADDPATTRRFARLILDAAERGAAITCRLLVFARRDVLRAEAIAPAALLSELHDVLAPTLGSPITVRVEADAALPPLLADKGQLETVLINLATNARDAMPEGGALTLAAVEENIPASGAAHPAGLAPGRYVRLTATDTGLGMDQATLARVAEPFFTTKPKGKGTGLGLPMAKSFAEQSGGGFAITSLPDRGTTVTLWLPAADGAAVPATDCLAAAGSDGAGPPRRVLLVDDEHLVRETLAAELEDAGCAVLVAGGGAQALALLERGEAVDALVSDLSMPGMSGAKLIEAAQQRRPGLLAVLLTGYADDTAELAGQAAFALLRKPTSGRVVAERVARLLGECPPA
jgi:PAS domain S-box-containing protein